jgi:hypothetical protein
VGRRARRSARLRAASSDYPDAAGNVLTLRGSLSLGSRRAYAQALAGDGPAATRDDASQRALEVLFERLAVSWVVAGVPMSDQRELVGRLRLASNEERAFVRQALREHCAEHFPDVRCP